MATANLNPNGDITVQWIQIGGSTYHFQEIDEGTVPVTTDHVYVQGVGDVGKIESFNMQSTTVGTVTQIEVKVYTYSYLVGGSSLGTVDIYLGSWKGTKQIINTNAVTQWTTYTWSGLSGSQAQLDALQVKFVAGDLETNSNCVTVHDYVFIYTMYVIVTYTTGYEHDFMGVPAANIGSVSGVPVVNIASIKGV